MLLVIIRFIQIFILILIITRTVIDIKNKNNTNNNEWEVLTVAKWLFYFPGVFFLGFSMTIYTIIVEKDVEGYSVAITLGIGCIIALMLMLLQQNWMLKFNDNKFIFRNTFLKTQVFNRSDIKFKTKGMRVQVFVNEKN